MDRANDTYRRLKAEQEPLFPGLAYAGAAAVGGSALVYRVRSVPVKILTPVALAAAAGTYFLPAHTDMIMGSWSPVRYVKSTADDVSSATSSTSFQELKRSADSTAFDLGHKTADTAEQVRNQAQASWDDIKRKGEDLAEAYREAGKDQVNKLVDHSVKEAKFWLDHQKAEADRLIDDTASTLNSKTHELHKKFQDSTSIVPEKPSTSRWSWWKSSESTEKVQRPSAESTDATGVIEPVPKSKPHKIVVDRAVASAAVKGHDDIINKNQLYTKDIEETARKVHDNVVDAALPKHRQGRYESHPIEVSRMATATNPLDGKLVVKENGDGTYVKVEKKTKKNDDHGLINLEKRAHMLYDGVEHLEHKINKRIQKSLEEEAEFWHQQSLKEASNERGSERGI